MTRGLAIGWLAAAAVFALLLGVELAQWRALSADAMRATGERRRLTDEIRLRDEQLAAALGVHARDLGRMLWTAAGGDPSAFLTRLAELAAEQRLKVMAVGPLERQATAQFHKSWHVIQVVGPFREIRELAARVEAERGILEDVRIEPAPAPPAGRTEGAAVADEVQARFRMTALELSPPTRRILDRVLAANRGPGPSGGATLPALPAPSERTGEGPSARDPFAFTGGRPSAARTGPAPAPSPAKLVVPLELSAIMSVAGGSLAVINNQIVKVGDTVSGHRVESITDQSVTLREPGAAPRTIPLPDLGAVPPPAPRR